MPTARPRLHGLMTGKVTMNVAPKSHARALRFDGPRVALDPFPHDGQPKA